VAQALNAPRDKINALNVWGSAELALGNSLRALELHREEEALALAVGLPDYAAGARARQANALLARGDLPGALALVEQVLAALHKLEDSAIYAPADIFLACTRVLLRAGDIRAGEVLYRAHAWLEEHLRRLHDDTHRRAFIENIPAHAALMQAWQARHSAPAASAP
jgi:hypothetical protein